MRIDDTQLFRRIQEKDEEALEQLYDRYEKLLFSFSLRMTNNETIAEEAVQDVFTKLWTKKLPYKKEKGKFSSWLLTITRNACLDLIRKTKTDNVEFQERDSLKEDNEPTPEEHVEWNEKRQQIKSAMQSLNDEQKEIIELFYFKGLSQSKISEACNIPLGTVKGRVRLALNHLNKQMENTNERGMQS